MHFLKLLFLGAGSVIHSLNDEQDIKKWAECIKNSVYMGVDVNRNTCINWLPFLSGFYSKDAIIEFAYLKNTSIGNCAAAIGMFTAF